MLDAKENPKLCSNPISQGICIADLGLGYSQLKEAVTLLMLAHNECKSKRREEIISILTTLNILLHRVNKLRDVIQTEDI